MPKNEVQFQRGMSLHEFLQHYGTEVQCEKALFAWRWPRGFICPECGYAGHCLLGRGLYQCHRCHHQSSLTAGTLFAGTKLSLRQWLLAMYLLSQAKSGMSALGLSRELGVSYNSAWLMKHKLMQAMLEREQARTLSGLIQIDDAYWGGRRAGKRGRGARGKTPFVAAVATDPKTGKPLTMRMDRVKEFYKREIERWSRKHLAPGSHVRSDGLRCFSAVKSARCTHEPIMTDMPKGRRRRNKSFVWVDTMLGNVKNAIQGTYHAIGAKHLPRYLAEFTYRFNRRFDLAGMLARLGTAAALTPPMPYRLVRLAEVHW